MFVAYIALFVAIDRGYIYILEADPPGHGRHRCSISLTIKFLHLSTKKRHFSSLPFSDKPPIIAFKIICKSRQLRSKLWQNCHFSAKHGALGRMATSLCSVEFLLLVWATINLAATIRVGATFKKKIILFY